MGVAGNQGTADAVSVMMQDVATSPGVQLSPNAALARSAVHDGVLRYIADRHARVAPFVDAHFSLPGTLRLHRAALGWDVARAPLNLVMAGPQVGLHATAAGVRRLGAHRLAERLDRPRLVQQTAVAREIGWLLHTELLELPAHQGKRHTSRDALAEAILADPALLTALQPMLAAIGAAGKDPVVRERMQSAVSEYAETRHAAAEIVTALCSLGTGAAALSKLTPGAMTLGPALAAILAQQAAIASFPLGTGLGSLWYAAFPAAPSAALLVGLTGGLMAGASVVAAFAGVLADPVQRRLGLHQRRLHRLIDALERQLLDPDSPGFSARDHYVARLLDMMDIVASVYRFALHG